MSFIAEPNYRTLSHKMTILIQFERLYRCLVLKQNCHKMPVRILKFQQKHCWANTSFDLSQGLKTFSVSNIPCHLAWSLQPYAQSAFPLCRYTNWCSDTHPSFDSSLIATKIGYTQLVYCVSPDFICKNNHIQHPYDLADKQRILIPNYQHHWHFINDHEKFSIHVKPILTTNQIAVAKRSCIDSLGVAGFFYYQVADAIKANELITIFESYNTELIPINIVYPHVKLISPRVQHFINWFKKRTDKMCFITQSTASQ